MSARESTYEEQSLRQLELAMWIVFNAKQRTERKFRKLLTQDDAILKVCLTLQLLDSSNLLTLNIACEGAR